MLFLKLPSYIKFVLVLYHLKIKTIFLLLFFSLPQLSTSVLWTKTFRRRSWTDFPHGLFAYFWAFVLFFLQNHLNKLSSKGMTVAGRIRLRACFCFFCLKYFFLDPQFSALLYQLSQLYHLIKLGTALFTLLLAFLPYNQLHLWLGAPGFWGI